MLEHWFLFAVGIVIAVCASLDGAIGLRESQIHDFGGGQVVRLDPLRSAVILEIRGGRAVLHKQVHPEGV